MMVIDRLRVSVVRFGKYALRSLSRVAIIIKYTGCKGSYEFLGGLQKLRSVRRACFFRPQTRKTTSDFIAEMDRESVVKDDAKRNCNRFYTQSGS